MSDSDINYTKEAFFNGWNLVFIITAVVVAAGVSFQTGAPDWLFELMLVFAAAAEFLYLGIMPRNERFRRLVRSKKAADYRPPSGKEIYRLLSKHSQRRYARLRKLQEDIRLNYRKLSYASQGLLDSHLQKIEGLLESFLNLVYQKERYENYTHDAMENEVARAIDELKEDMKGDPPRLRSIKKRRLKILEQRMARFQRGRDNLAVIEAQLETIEDVIKYIHEQSITLRNPEEITFQLDLLLNEVEETEASVEEIESVFSAASETANLLDELDEEEPLKQDPESTQRSERLRN